MKINYTFVNGESTNLEVADEFGTMVLDLDRQEFNNNHTEKRRHCSLEAYDLDNNLIPSKENIEEDFIRSDEYRRLYLAVKSLEPQQQDLLKRVFWNGELMADIARKDGVSKTAITNRMKKITTKLKKIMQGEG